MNTPTIALSRAELAEAINALSGGEPKPKQKDGLYTNWIIGPWQWSTHKQQWILIKDPTRDIGEAFALKEWLWEYGEVEARSRFADEWHRVIVYNCTLSGPDFAEWICCTVHWAVEGQKVELRDL